MKPSLEKIQKFIKLEAERGYDNKAVVGGLDKIYSAWQAEARSEGLAEEFIQAVGARLRDYSALTPASRADMLSGLWRRLGREMGTALPPLAQPAESEPRFKERRPEQRPSPAQERERPSRGEPRPQRTSDEKPANRAPGETQRQQQPMREKYNREGHPRPERSEHRSGPPQGQERRAPIPPPPPPVASEPQAEERTPVREGSAVFESPVIPTSGDFLDAHKPAPAPQTVVSPSKPVNTRMIPTSGPLAAHRRISLPAGSAPAALDAPLTVLPGVGEKHAGTLARLGLQTLGDMLYFFPRRYLDYSELKPINRLFFGEVTTILGVIQSISARPTRTGKMHITEAIISDGSGGLRVTWFNQPWLSKRLQPGAYVSISGKVEQYLGRLVMNNPELEPLDQEHLHTNRIVPVYPLTANITQRWLRGMMHQVITYWAERVRDPLYESLRQNAKILDLNTALLQVHFPDNMEQLKLARYRLAFDEIFLLQLGVLAQKRSWQENTARVFTSDPAWFEAQEARLPFSLTGAQQRAIQDVTGDLASGHPMNRLIQGDVGSGKTIIAALAAALIASQGAQTAVLAPTSILAEQHYKNLLRVLCAGDENDLNAPLRPEQIRLMLGATSESEKAEIRGGLENGEIKLIVGTHAILEDPVTFADLELAVIDEQHRFGVQQRAALRSKGRNPHLMVMTATPIPRSLALTVYGDLDLSVLDEMPPGRQPVETQVFYPLERERAYQLIRGQVSKGRQAFIIYPLVEETENEASAEMAAVEAHERLQKEIFPNLQLGLLHGRLKPDEKEATMTEFRDGKTHILVSTSVVEVGVDVPNATVMLIEGANRFGLSQLHQFRGRVGRGQDQAYCVLIPDTPDAVENERLAVMAETTDGFILAERDLEQRGPGDFLGTRQSGYHSEVRLASLTDIHLIENARRHAQQIFTTDPDLSQPQHQVLADAVRHAWDPGQGDIS